VAALILAAIFGPALVRDRAAGVDVRAEAPGPTVAVSVPRTMDVGQCLPASAVTDNNADDVAVVDCGGADAGYQIVGRVDDLTFDDLFVDAVCASYPSTEFKLWVGRDGELGAVLCLVALTSGS
jgi:hypothetical protein